MRKRTMNIGSPDRIAMVRIASTPATSRLRSMTTSGKNIGQKFEKSLGSRTGLRPERVSNRQSLDDLSVLQVLRIKRRAVRFESRNDDLSVVDTEPVLLRHLQGRFMRIQCD